MKEQGTEYVEMTNEEYRVKIQKMICGVEDSRLLRYFYVYISEKIKRVQR